MTVAGETVRKNGLKFKSAWWEFYLQINKLVYFYLFYQLQLLWTYYVFTCYFVILKFFASPYLGASDFGCLPVFRKSLDTILGMDRNLTGKKFPWHGVCRGKYYTLKNSILVHFAQYLMIHFFKKFKGKIPFLGQFRAKYRNISL